MMHKFTVILVYPLKVAEVYGETTTLHVEAKHEQQAIVRAQFKAVEQMKAMSAESSAQAELVTPYEFRVVIVLLGHLRDARVS